MDKYLDVPFNENEEAKALGAAFDPGVKRWYVPDWLHFELFLKWHPGNRRQVNHEPPRSSTPHHSLMPCEVCGGPQLCALVLNGRKVPVCVQHYDAKR